VAKLPTPVTRALGASKSSINRNVLRYRATGSYDRRRGQGRKRSTTVRDDRFIVLQTLRNRSQTAVQTRSAFEEVRGIQISQRTVRRRLKEVELGSYIPAKAPKLEVRHQVARLAFGREHANWNIDQWSQVFFTDESRFCTTQSTGGKEYGDVEENDIPNVISLQKSLLVEAQLWSGAE
jgi:transposase